jgi:hypothetical protein
VGGTNKRYLDGAASLLVDTAVAATTAITETAGRQK